MTIASEVQRIKTNIANAYTACNNKGATMPATQNSANLANCIESISGGTTPTGILSITANGTYDVTDYASAEVDVSGGSGVISNINDNYIVGTTGDINLLTKGTTQLSPNATEISTTRAYNTAYKSKTTVKEVHLGKVTTISGYMALYQAFQSCTNLISVDLSGLTTVSDNQVLYSAFQACTKLTSANLSNLAVINSAKGLQNVFSGCGNLTSVDLSSLTTVSSSYAMSNAFRGCMGLTSVDLSSLTTVSGQDAMQSAFYNCTGLTNVDLSNLATVSGKEAMNGAFSYCTRLATLSFPSLNSNSFGSYTNQFYSMLLSVTGCTVHFPSNLQSVIGSWSSVTSGFGGTNTTVLFDLPATT